MNSLKNILVAIDFGRASEAALAQALRMAAWNRATVHAVHVVFSHVACVHGVLASARLRQQPQQHPHHQP